jgi:ankyrin repeat domain-containing protein 50
LVAAAQYNHGGVVKRLLRDESFGSDELGYQVNHVALQGRTAISYAASSGFLEVVRHLLNHENIQPDLAAINRWTPLFWAASLDVLQVLLTDSRVSANHLDSRGRNTLWWAASGGHLELVKYLMSLNHIEADTGDETGRTALSWAAGNGIC